MADDRTIAQRSETMRRVRSRGTSCETALLRALRALGARPTRADSPTALVLPGKPDVVFCRARVAVFVDGCFWHGCPAHCRLPASNRLYWLRKIARNRARDRASTHALRARGWRVLRIWEHSVEADPARAARRIVAALAASRGVQ